MNDQAKTPPGGEATSARAPRRLPYGDALRALAAVVVVLIHTARQGVSAYGEIPSENWWVCNVLVAASRWAVPVFFMLSGALLLDPAREYPLGRFYARRLLHVGPPLLFWTAFYLSPLRSLMGQPPVAPREALALVATGMPFYHLYFLYAIVGLYLFTPLLRPFAREASQRTLVIMSVLALAFVLGDEGLSKVLRQDDTGTLFSRLLPFLGYYLLGYGLAALPGAPRRRALLWSLFVLCTAVTAAGYWALAARGLSGNIAYSYSSPLVVLMSVCVFMLVAQSPVFNRTEGRGARFVARWVAPATLGIYLIHPAVLHFGLAHGMPLAAAPLPWLTVPAVCLLVTAVSWGLTLLLRAVPGLRYIVG